MELSRRPASWSVGLCLAVLIQAGCTADPAGTSDALGQVDQSTRSTFTVGWSRESRPVAAPRIRVVEPADESTVTESFAVQVALEGVRVAPAGRVRHGEGHWQILVDQPCIDAGQPSPVDGNVHRVDDGTLISRITLAEGERDLCVQMVDGYGIATNIRDFVTVTVTGGGDGESPPDGMDQDSGTGR